MAFKQKPCKIKFTQELKTLDEIYTETIQKFDNVSNDILTLKKKILKLKNKIKDITDILELICDPNTMKEGRIYIKEYDLKYDKGGAIYNSKETRYFYEVLG